MPAQVMIAQAGRNFKKPTFLVLLDRLRDVLGREERPQPKGAR